MKEDEKDAMKSVNSDEEGKKNATEEKLKKAPVQKPALSPEWTLFSR